MNKRLLEKGYTPISNEIPLLIPGTKKPVLCCFTEYITKTGIDRHQFVYGSKYIALDMVHHYLYDVSGDLEIFIYDNIDAFVFVDQYKNFPANVKGDYIENAKGKLGLLPSFIWHNFVKPNWAYNFIALSKDEKVSAYEKIVDEGTKRDPDGKYPIRKQDDWLECNTESAIRSINKWETDGIFRAQKIKTFYGL